MIGKILKIFFIILGIIFLVVVINSIIISKLGVEPLFCITGNFPDLKIESCDPQTTSISDGSSLPLNFSDNPIPMIFDDDGSPDGIIALMYFLQHPNYDVQAVTISLGEAHPQLFANHMAQLLADLGRGDIPVGYGRETPLEGENAFPEPWRDGSDQLFSIQLENIANPVVPRPAQEIIVEVLSNSPDPMVFFVSGTLTNLAEVLRDDPEIIQKISSVYVMGGAVNVSGNIHQDWPEINNSVAEWNIWVDPVAAHEVFSSGLELHLVPLDATNQITWAAKDIRKWTKTKKPEAIYAGNFADIMVGMSPNGRAFIWDLVTATVASDASLCPEVQLALDVKIEPGSEQGQLIPVNEPANIWVCLEPDANQIRARVEYILGQ